LGGAEVWVLAGEWNWGEAERDRSLERSASLERMADGQPAFAMLQLPCLRLIRRSYRYAIQFVVIRSFRHKGVQAFFERGSKAGIQAAHAPRLARQLSRLNLARAPQDMNVPGWRLHQLLGRELSGHWSVWVSGNWRLTFKFDGEDVILVDYQDYH
jgi:proteic killer suppression protein